MHLGLGTKPDGTLREVFIDVHREGSPVRAMYHLIAQLTSIALHEGVSAQRIAKAFRSVHEGALTVDCHDNAITEAVSVCDYIGQIIERECVAPMLAKGEAP